MVDRLGQSGKGPEEAGLHLSAWAIVLNPPRPAKEPKGNLAIDGGLLRKVPGGLYGPLRRGSSCPAAEAFTACQNRTTRTETLGISE